MSDAEDAARYRWLKTQFDRIVEDRHWQEHVGENSKGQLLYERREEYWYRWEFKDDWRFGETVNSKDRIRDFDAIIDDLRRADSASAPDEVPDSQ